MPFLATIITVGVAALASTVQAGPYSNKLMMKTPQDFYNNFYFSTAADPSGGTVNYVDAGTAQSLGLVGDNGRGGFHMGVDTKSTGTRQSVRLESNNHYSDGLYIVDLNHAPSGCGTWPAIWTVADNWPAQGEIDIMEQVNGVTSRGNSATLHTSAGCTMPAQRNEGGTAFFNDCNVQDGANGNEGCGVSFNKANSFGQNFNGAGGGVYAMQRDSSGGIYVWFFPRGQEPAGTTGGATGDLDPADWGTPDASFPPTDCNFSQHFGPHRMIINIDFCGGFVDTFYSGDGCPADCISYVANNPGAFTEAFFDFNSYGYWALNQ